MTSHEDDLLSILNKVGQKAQDIQVDAGEPAVLDASTVVVTGDREQSNPRDDTSTPPPPVMVGEVQDKGYTSVTRKNLFVHHDTHPVVYDIALLKQYNTDWMVWEADTLWKEIKEDFHVPSISDHAKTKIQAVRTLHILDTFWTNWEVFCWINQALNNNIPDWHVIQKPAISQMVNSVDISAMVRSGETFNSEVQGFAAASFLDEGVLYAPPPMDFCQAEILQYLDDRDVEYSMESISEVEHKHKVVSSMSLSDWHNSEGTVLHETVSDIQVAKLKVAWDYLKMRRQQLKEQLLLLS